MKINLLLAIVLALPTTPISNAAEIAQREVENAVAGNPRKSILNSLKKLFRSEQRGVISPKEMAGNPKLPVQHSVVEPPSPKSSVASNVLQPESSEVSVTSRLSRTDAHRDEL